MDVFTIELGWFRAETKAMPRITKRRVLKTGTVNLTLSPLFEPGDPLKVPVDRCYTSLEDAQREMAALVSEKVSQLNTRIRELKEEPKYDESYIFSRVEE
jgi:hypothetical protein